MSDIKVRNYRVIGFYRTKHGVNKHLFEKEARATNPEDAVEKIIKNIGALNVKKSRIKVEKVIEITETGYIKDRVTRTYAEEEFEI